MKVERVVLAFAFVFAMFLIWQVDYAVAASKTKAKETAAERIIRQSRMSFTVKDKNGTTYKLYLYADKEKVGYDPYENKQKIYRGTYKLALLDKANKKKLAEIKTNIEAVSAGKLVTGTGMVRIFPNKKGQPSLVGTGIVYSPSSELLTFDDMYYVEKNKLHKLKVTADSDNFNFINPTTFKNPKPNVYTTIISHKNIGTVETNWQLQLASKKLVVTSMKWKTVDGIVENIPVFSFTNKITFKDKYLEEAIRETLKKPTGTIYLKDLDQLKTLKAEYRGIVDLSGLEYARNLKTLIINYNGIDEKTMWPLKGLTKLTRLEFSNNHVTNIDFMLEVPGDITTLDIGNNPIESIEPLADKTDLEKLYIYGTLVSNLKPIAGLYNLKDLDLSRTDVKNISPLKNLKNLEILWMDSVSVSSFSALANLTNLKTLNIDNTFYGSDDRIDGSPLKNLKELENLYIIRVRFEDYQFLNSLTNLKSLHAYYSSISLNDLKNLQSLEYLDLHYSNIDDISGLADLTNLEYLDISSNRITNLDALSNLNKLRELYASDNEIEDLRPISRLTNLESLMLWRNKITDLHPLLPLTNLRRLSVDENPIVDFSPLEKLPMLEMDEAVSEDAGI